MLSGIASAYIADHPEQDGSGTGKRDRNAAALAWLLARGVTVPMASVAAGITADAAMIGGASAQAAVNGDDDADTGDWEPGDTGTAWQVAGALGVAGVLALAGGSDSAGGAADDVAGDMEDGYLTVVARVLAGWDPEVAADELAGMIEDAVTDGDYAEALSVTQISIVSGQAALDYYLANSVSMVSWVTEDAQACAQCKENQRVSPLRAGTPFPSGDLAPLAHPGCRCALVPADL